MTVGYHYGLCLPEQRTRLLLLLIRVSAWPLSTAADSTQSLEHGVMPVTGIWVAGPAPAWAVQYGRRAGAIAALILSGCDFLLRSEAITVALNGLVLLLLAGVVVGHLARLAAEAETNASTAIQIEAAEQGGTRLARDIHDSALQALGDGGSGGARRRAARRPRSWAAGGPAGSRAAFPGGDRRRGQPVGRRGSGGCWPLDPGRIR